MRIAVLADIHANDDALRAVLHDALRHGVSGFECLGDLVGYHAFPCETLDLLADHGVTSVSGNHDLMVLGRLAPTNCGPRARAAIEFTQRHLSAAHLERLQSLPTVRLGERWAFVHSAPDDPEIRLRTPQQFRCAAAAVWRLRPEARICFTGHTHIPSMNEVVAKSEGGERRIRFINPGSVGDPRDGDARASYAVFDTEHETVKFRRVAYDASRVIEAGVREGLIDASLAAPRFGARALALARAIAETLT
ncbi:MAG TPA: metallophosphoesterase family protein [Gemmatimonadaceae bacterium]|jgi:predicted phosphodiesterase